MGHEMAKSTYVSGETGGRRGHRSDSLTSVPTPSPSALPIRRLTHRDLTACADLSEDRGWPREEHKWGLLLSAGKGYGIDDPDGGLVTACVITEYGPYGSPSLGAIGMVLVAERHSRQHRPTADAACRRRDGHDSADPARDTQRPAAVRGAGLQGDRPGGDGAGTLPPRQLSVDDRHARGHRRGSHHDPPARRGGVRHRSHPCHHPAARLRRSAAGGRGQRSDHRLRGRLAQHGHAGRRPADRPGHGDREGPAGLPRRPYRPGPCEPTSTCATRSCWRG